MEGAVTEPEHELDGLHHHQIGRVGQQTSCQGLGEESDEEEEILERGLKSVEEKADHNDPDETPKRLEGEDGGHIADLDSDKVLEIQEGRAPDRVSHPARGIDHPE